MKTRYNHALQFVRFFRRTHTFTCATTRKSANVSCRAGKPCYIQYLLFLVSAPSRRRITTRARYHAVSLRHPCCVQPCGASLLHNRISTSRGKLPVWYPDPLSVISSCSFLPFLRIRLLLLPENNPLTSRPVASDNISQTTKTKACQAMEQRVRVTFEGEFVCTSRGFFMCVCTRRLYITDLETIRDSSA